MFLILILFYDDMFVVFKSCQVIFTNVIQVSFSSLHRVEINATPHFTFKITFFLFRMQW